MENIDVLIEKIKTYRSWCERAQQANSYAKLDEAKVEGIKSLKNLQLQLARAGREISLIATERRSALDQQARQAVYRLTSTPQEEPTTELPSTSRVETVKKSSKRASKKAKK